VILVAHKRGEEPTLVSLDPFSTSRSGDEFQIIGGTSSGPLHPSPFQSDSQR